ncbi:MAG: RluA family pseudouridine synthase [Betaproteobacteria bacterium]
MKELSKAAAVINVVGEEAAGQRIDNFLIRHCKGVPRSHVYRILRSGEVRVNSGRVDATYRLQSGDKVRIPPIRIAAKQDADRPAPPRELAIVYEDDALLVVDKPSGYAVHGGSGVSFGVIEGLRAARPEARFLELVHRIDRETSGLLILAKKRSALTTLHAAMRDGAVQKCYLALVKGVWPKSPAKRDVSLALKKYVTKEGERRVSVDKEGQEARTVFRLERSLGEYSLLQAELKTGRTHQIRVHLAHLGFPIAGDDKYGDFDLNKLLLKKGLKRMFLHAASLAFEHPLTGERMRLAAPLPPELQKFADRQVESA